MLALEGGNLSGALTFVRQDEPTTLSLNPSPCWPRGPYTLGYVTKGCEVDQPAEQGYQPNTFAREGTRHGDALRGASAELFMAGQMMNSLQSGEGKAASSSEPPPENSPPRVPMPDPRITLGQRIITKKWDSDAQQWIDIEPSQQWQSPNKQWDATPPQWEETAEQWTEPAQQWEEPGQNDDPRVSPDVMQDADEYSESGEREFAEQHPIRPRAKGKGPGVGSAERYKPYFGPRGHDARGT